MEIQQYAVNYAANIAHRKSVAGKLTVVKGVGVRGCILLMAGVLQSPDDHPQDFHDEAAELIDCLSDELKNETMDVTIGEWTGRFVDGVVESVENRKGHVEVPEVVLVSEPCCVQGVRSKMDIYFSEGSGNWDSLNVVTVVENVIKQKDLLHESKHQQLLYVRVWLLSPPCTWTSGLLFGVMFFAFVLLKADCAQLVPTLFHDLKEKC